MAQNISNPKPPVNHLHTLNLTVALVAGIISIVGGVFTIKSNFFSAPKYGNISGVIRDEVIAKPLWLSTVEILDEGNLVVDSAKTEQDGTYLLKDLKEGDYTVKVSAPLHANQSKPVRVESGKTASINVDLVPLQQKQTEVPVASAVVPASNYPQTVTPASSQQVVPVQTTTAATSSYPASSGTSWGKGSDYNGYSSSSTYPSRPHRGPPGGMPPPGSSGSSSQSALAQISGQLLQQWANKRSENDSN